MTDDYEVFLDSDSKPSLPYEVVVDGFQATLTTTSECSCKYARKENRAKQNIEAKLKGQTNRLRQN